VAARTAVSTLVHKVHALTGADGQVTKWSVIVTLVLCCTVSENTIPYGDLLAENGAFFLPVSHSASPLLFSLYFNFANHEETEVTRLFSEDRTIVA